jgi:hypothetical protein
MSHESRVASHGVTRRDFLRTSAAVAPVSRSPQLGCAPKDLMPPPNRSPRRWCPTRSSASAPMARSPWCGYSEMGQGADRGSDAGGRRARR